jgi:hypothetical protein
MRVNDPNNHFQQQHRVPLVAATASTAVFDSFKVRRATNKKKKAQFNSKVDESNCVNGSEWRLPRPPPKLGSMCPAIRIAFPLGQSALAAVSR